MGSPVDRVAATAGSKERINGVTEAVRTAVRTAEIDLGGDYDGWRVTMRLNPSTAVWDDFSSGDTERYDSALAVLILDWNFVDDNGNPLPLPSEGLDWSIAPFDLKLVVTNAYSARMQERMSLGKPQSTISEPTSPSAT